MEIEEYSRLIAYLRKLRRGELLTREEAEDFKTLAEKMAKERSNDPLAALLVGLAGFVHGVVIASSAISMLGRERR